MLPKSLPLDLPATYSARTILATNIVAFRAEKGWSQEILGFETGLHRTFIAHVERGVRNISIDNLEKIAVAFGIAPYQLLQPHTQDLTI